MVDKIFKDMQNPVPFSRSPCWSLLREYYQKEGPKAWNSQIPYYATSNMNLAYAYAELLVAYYLDWKQEYGLPVRPLHILELGAGSARFSYYLLIALGDVAKVNQLEPTCFKLIISDFVEDNIKNWLDHKQFQDYFKKGLLDCIQYDLQSEPSLMCLYSRKKMTLEDFSIPPFVLAHYVMDSLPIDVFRVRKGNLFAVHVGLDLDKSSEYKKEDIRRLVFQEKLLPIKDQYYKDVFQNQLIKSAAEEIQNGYFDFPVAGFKLLETLHQNVGGRFMFSCIDKGAVDWLSYQRKSFPPIFYHHNTFSFDFNFCMFNKYLEKKEGHSLWIGSNRQLIKWQIASCNVDIKNTPAIDRFARIRLKQNAPIDYLYYYLMAAEMNFDLPLTALSSLLVQSCWDPVCFVKMGNQLVRKIADTTLDERGFLFAYFDTLENNFLVSGDSGDIYLIIGNLYHAIDAYVEAIAYYQKSKDRFGEGYAVYYALGKSYFSSGDSATAITMFLHAQKFKLTKQLKFWLEYFGKDSTYRKVKKNIEKKRIEKSKNKKDSDLK